jgi:hypothetical protein
MRTLILVWSLAWLPAAGYAAAQGGASSASVGGRVVDSSGAVLPGVAVSVINESTNQTRTIVTDGNGLYRVYGLTPSTYTVAAELQGFATTRLTGLVLNVGAVVERDVIMALASVSETVTVTSESPLVEAARTDMSTLVSRDQIESLPTNSRNYLDFALLTPMSVENFTTSSPQQGIGVNIGGARAKESSLLVDGFWNTDESFGRARIKYAQDAVQEFQVVSLGGAAEYGRAIGGVVSAVTRSGGNRLSGSAYEYYRNKDLNAQTPLEKQRGLPKSNFNRNLFGGSVGGPIVPNRTFYFGAVERTVQDTPADNNITPENGRIIGLPAEDVGTLPSTVRGTFAMAKVNHNLTATQTLSGSFIFHKYIAVNTEFQSFTARSRTIGQHERDWAYQVQWTKIANEGRWLHELKGAYFPRRYMRAEEDTGGPPLVPDGQLRARSAPQVNITSVANFGGAFINNRMWTAPTQAIYTSTVAKDNHSLKFGVDTMFVNFDYWQYANSGSYSFRNLASYQRGEYTTYTQRFGEPLLERYHTLLSGFAQDSWQAGKRLTLNYGVRYDLEILSKFKGQHYGEDKNNVAPRFAMSYDLTGKGRTLVKLSTGLYYDHMFQNPITPAYFENKSVGQQLTITYLFGQPGAPTYPNTLTALPANAPTGIRNVWVVPPDYEIPGSWQLVGTIDHAFSDTLAANVNVLYSKSWSKEMAFDTNLLFDDARQLWVRPDPEFRQISQYRYNARAEYTGVVGEVRKRVRDKLTLNTNFTWARSYDMSNNYTGAPNDQRFPEREFAPSADTPVWRVVSSGAYDITETLQASAIYRGRGGYAFDPRSGATFDLNGDGVFNDRTPTLERNSFRGPDTHMLDTRVAYTLRRGKQQKLQFAVEAFNLLNKNNVRGVQTLYGPDPNRPDPAFSTPLNYWPPREVQLGVRISF